MSKKFLIYGSGSIGCVLAYSLLNSGNTVFLFCRKKNFGYYKKNGIQLEIFNNKNFKKKIELSNYKKLILISDINKLKSIKLNAIFITTKIITDLEKILKTLNKFISKNTLLITPCTGIPFWWYMILKNKKNNVYFKKISKYFDNNLKRKNLVAMTMWLSSTKVKKGVFRLNHVQRGFPIKEVFPHKKTEVDKIRLLINKTIKSISMRNVYYEIFVKSINSLVFNMAAIFYDQNNIQLNNNIEAKKKILIMLNEGNKILNKLNIKVYQSSSSRINQTLSSTAHTMSMLKDYRLGKKIEINQIWKSLKVILDLTNLNMKKTEEFYKKVSKQIKKKY